MLSPYRPLPDVELNEMKRPWIAWITLILAAAGVAFADGPKTVFIYYYAWYGNPTADGQWMHWQDNGHLPPQDISSSFYPALGPYSSGDLQTIDRHMRWIAGANINALIYSWWGQNDYTDQVARKVLDAAADYNLKVSFLIEPYPGRTPRSLCLDVEYLLKKYGNHPALFQSAQKTAYSQNPGSRPMFFIYNPDFAPGEMKQVADEIHASDHDSLLLVQSTNAGLIDAMHVDGLFAYEAVQSVMHFYKGLVRTINQKNSIFVPCVSPGFNMRRTANREALWFRPRLAGSTYDEWWQETIAADPQFVAIISFNEWHEGTQIEPALSARFPLPNYVSYLNAYGDAAGVERSYLRRTALWIDLFLEAQP
jgi:hypothetical protein